MLARAVPQAPCAKDNLVARWPTFRLLRPACAWPYRASNKVAGFTLLNSPHRYPLTPGGSWLIGASTRACNPHTFSPHGGDAGFELCGCKSSPLATC